MSSAAIRPPHSSHPILRTVLLLTLTAGLALAWYFYNQPPLTSRFPSHFHSIAAKLVPLYANHKPIDFSADGAIRRAALSITLAAASVGALLATFLLRPARRRRGWLTALQLTLAIAGTLAINVSLAHVRGQVPNPHGRSFLGLPVTESSFTRPFNRPALEYAWDVPKVRDDPLAFIQNYNRPRTASRLAPISPRLTHHAATHPPGGVLFLWAGHKLFGHPTNLQPNLPFSAWLASSFTALAVLPTYWLARALRIRRPSRLLPLYLLVPNLVLFGATSMDGVFLVFVLSSLASAFWALRRPTILRLLLAGSLFWLAAFMTYATIAVPFLLLAYVLVTAVRRDRVALITAGAALTIVLLFIGLQLAVQKLTGYDFLATAQAAMDRDLHGLSRSSRYEGFEKYRQLSLGNLAAFLFGTGLPLTAAAGLALLKPARFSIALALTLVTLAASTLFTLETERVWLFLAPCLLLAALPALKPKPAYALALLLLALQTYWTEFTFDTLW